MKIISSYGVELRKQNIPIRQTLEIYRSAVCQVTDRRPVDFQCLADWDILFS